VRKLIIAVVVLAACQRQVVVGFPSPTSAPVSGGQTGATSATSAVQAFMKAVESQDLQAMSTIWGTRDGSVLETRSIPREEVERRELIMLCYLKHDRYRVLGDAPAPDGKRVVATELTRGGLTRSTNFYVVSGPGGRWLVENVDLDPLKDFLGRGDCVTR
jgi:hypothetical protein